MANEIIVVVFLRHDQGNFFVEQAARRAANQLQVSRGLQDDSQSNLSVWVTFRLQIGNSHHSKRGSLKFSVNICVNMHRTYSTQLTTNALTMTSAKVDETSVTINQPQPFSGLLSSRYWTAPTRKTGLQDQMLLRVQSYNVIDQQSSKNINDW